MILSFLKDIIFPKYNYEFFTTKPKKLRIINYKDWCEVYIEGKLYMSGNISGKYMFMIGQKFPDIKETEIECYHIENLKYKNKPHCNNIFKVIKDIDIIDSQGYYINSIVIGEYYDIDDAIKYIKDQPKDTQNKLRIQV